MKITLTSKELQPLANLFGTHKFNLSGLNVKVTSEVTKGKNIIFEYNQGLKEEEYRPDIADDIRAEAANYQSMAMGVATLLQLATVSKGNVTFPNISISDKPDYGFRIVLLDLARFWQSGEKVLQMQ